MDGKENQISKDLEQKLVILALEKEDTIFMLRNGTVSELKEQADFYETSLHEIRTLQRECKRQMVVDGVSLQEVKDWDLNIIAQKREVENVYYEVTKAMEAFQDDEKREQEDSLRLELEKLKLSQNVRPAPPVSAAVTPKVLAHVPKLTISKFQGTHLDWWRFWNQFEAEIDSSPAIHQVTKFSYLKEYLLPKVRLLVEGLPFTIEGYARAKNILQTKYGQISEVVNAHVQKIINLPTVPGVNPNKIYEFYECLVCSVQTLDSLGKLNDIKGYVRVTLDKLPQLRSQLVQFDDNWKDWEFPQLLEALRKWTERNPCTSKSEFENQDRPRRNEQLLQTSSSTEEGRRGSRKACVYCDSTEHKSPSCDEYVDVATRKSILFRKRLCFVCTGSRHCARDCESTMGCRNCNKKHHTSICPTASPVNEDEDHQTPSAEPMLAVSDSSAVTYPIVIVRVNGLLCRAMLDCCAGSSYVSSGLIERAGLRKIRDEDKSIKMMFHTSKGKINIYHGKLSSMSGNFSLDVEMSEVERSCLLTVPNPRYKEQISKYSHLKGVVMDDKHEKEELPVHIVLGTGEFTRLKTATAPRVGKEG